ncbi:MAG: AMP-binding protein, partial [Actinomycetia bacterium]|nr:AMP-binding protein [Actinomycetes bacterium]
MYLTQTLHRAVQQHPGRTATIFGDRARTFAEHRERVERLAGALRALGVRDGARVAMMSLNSDRYMEYLMAVLWAGGVVVPVNTRWSSDEIAASLDDCAVAVLITDTTFREQAAEMTGRCASVSALIDAGESGEPAAGALDYESLIAGAEPVDDAWRHGDDLAAIFYTGGTTGRAKGVMLSHANLMTSALGLIASGAFATPGGAFLH